MDSNVLQPPTSADQLYRELEDLRQKTAAERDKIDSLTQRIDETLTQRDSLNAEVKRISEDVRKLKEKRNALNARVKELKQKRDEFQTTASQKREALSKLLKQAGEISEQLEGNMSELSKQIKSLDWYIQTNPLAPKIERNLVARIGELEAKLRKHKGLRDVRDKLLKLRMEVGALRMQAQASHDELTTIAKESEKTHASMQELVKALWDRKKIADAKHSEFVEQSKQRYEAITTFKSHTQRISEIRSQIGEVKVSSKVEKGEKVKSKYKEAAEEKLKSGGKLSMEEFQALMADTLPESDDE